MLKRIIALFLLLSALFSLSSCKKEKPIEYCELGIVLTRDFETYDSSGAFHAAYSDGTVIVGITRYSFVSCEENGLLTTWTPRRFATVYLEMSDKVTDEGVMVHGDVPYFSYTGTDNTGNRYFYMPTFYRTPYAYFVITFITPESNKEAGRVEFLKYTETVYILEEHI